MRKISKQNIITLIAALAIVGSTGGCASFGRRMKALVGGHPAPANQQQSSNPSSPDQGIQRDNMANVPDRHYGHVTEKELEHQAHLESDAGSLWVPQGQGAYLFSENLERLPGDMLNVKLEGAALEQLKVKARVIASLLHSIEMEQLNSQTAVRKPASTSSPSSASQQTAGTTAPAPAAKPTSMAANPFTVSTVPTRVVKDLPDGSYQVQGKESFMIGKYEYQVLVAGIVRSQDFSSQGVSSTKLLDPHFDIISSPGGEQ